MGILPERKGHSERTAGCPNPSATPSPDYRSVVWYGANYSFTKSQAKCVEILWKAWENGTPEMDGLTVLTGAEAAGTRLIDVFRDNDAWGKMIQPGTTKGSYRLNPEEMGKTPPKEKKKTQIQRKSHR